MSSVNNRILSFNAGDTLGFWWLTGAPAGQILAPGVTVTVTVAQT